MSAEPRIVILGAGPTGLGAAWRLEQRGHRSWSLDEASSHGGGLASSVLDPRGFTWDLGGHVLFSHYRYFDAVMEAALGDAWVEHVREAWVWMRERWIPYPFQNNIWRLPDAERNACVEGLQALQSGVDAHPPPTFREWLLRSFGQGICDAFLFPYNRKVWAYEPSRLNVQETSAGETVGYDALISTMPLDRLLMTIGDAGGLQSLAPRFVHSSSHIVGIALRGTVPDALATKCWIYFPERQVPFYRATVFSNYSPQNAPPGHWSLMAEVSESPDTPVVMETIVDDVVSAFARYGFIDPAMVVGRWHRRLEYGYPTPWVGRDQVLGEVEQALTTAGIFSRGRFGAWKYEVSNQDHSLMQGVEAVERILVGTTERTYNGEMTSEL